MWTENVQDRSSCIHQGLKQNLSRHPIKEQKNKVASQKNYQRTFDCSYCPFNIAKLRKKVVKEKNEKEFVFVFLIDVFGELLSQI